MTLAGALHLRLSEFLLARIAEDEEWAPALSCTCADGPGSFGPHLLPSCPTRVLAECKAKRRIVEAFLDAERAVATYDHAHPTDAYWQEWGNRHALALAVELFALPYADHPGYQPEWAPAAVPA